MTRTWRPALQLMAASGFLTAMVATYLPWSVDRADAAHAYFPWSSQPAGFQYILARLFATAAPIDAGAVALITNLGLAVLLLLVVTERPLTGLRPLLPLLGELLLVLGVLEAVTIPQAGPYDAVRNIGFARAAGVYVLLLGGALALVGGMLLNFARGFEPDAAEPRARSASIGLSALLQDGAGAGLALVLASLFVPWQTGSPRFRSIWNEGAWISRQWGRQAVPIDGLLILALGVIGLNLIVLLLTARRALHLLPYAAIAVAALLVLLGWQEVRTTPAQTAGAAAPQPTGPWLLTAGALAALLFLLSTYVVPEPNTRD